MTERVGQGGTIDLIGEYRDGTSSLVDPVTPLVDILDPTSVALVTDAVPVRVTQGVYRYSYTAPTNATLGYYTANWTGTINGVPVSAPELFEVTAAGSISFTRSDIVTVDEIEEACGGNFTATERLNASILIRLAQAQIEGYLNRPIVLRAFDEVITADAVGDVYFRVTPVASILLVEDVGGSAPLALPSYSYTRQPWGLALGTANTITHVRYLGGYDSPEWARAMVFLAVCGEVRRLRMSTSGKASTFGAKAIRVEDYEIQYDTGAVASGGGGGIQLVSAPELSSISRYKRRAAG